MTILDDPLLSTVYLQHLSNNLLEHLVIVFFNVSRILLFNYTLKSNILETLKKQSLNVPVDCLINVANKQLTVNVL